MSEIYQAFSPYNYTLNNPIKFVDPNGMWVENAESYSTNDPDEIREFFRSSQRSNEESSNQNINQESTEGNCCPGNGNKRGPSGGSDGGSASGVLGWGGVGLGVVEEGANLFRTSQTVLVTVYNESGKAIAGWNVISKQTGQVLKYIKAGASFGGYATA